MSLLELQELTYIYNARTPNATIALDSISLTVESGEFIGVIGQTGSGKSTLIQHLNGLLRPTSGKILVDGKDLWDEKKNRLEARFRIGLVFQYPEYQLFEETVEKDIAFGPKNMGLGELEIHQRVKEALAFVGLGDEILSESPFSLSGGQKRRVAIAGVMAMHPEVLVLDEPTAGLDPKGRREILNQIKQYHQALGATVLLISHSMDEIVEYASKILMLKGGKVASFGSVAETFSDICALQQMGLDAPQVTQVFALLKEMGCPVRSNIFTLKDALDEIERVAGSSSEGVHPC